MALTNNPIELLLALNVADGKSRNNIQNYINKLQKELQLDLKINSSSGNLFAEMEKEISNLKRQVNDLSSEMGNIGKSKGSAKGNLLNLQGDLTSLDELKRRVTELNGSYRVDFKVDESGNKQVSSVIAKVKDEFGNIEQMKFKPIIDPSGVMTGIKQVKESFSDIGSKELTANIAKATSELNKLARQGELTSKEYDDFRNSISMAIDNSSLNKIVTSMRELNNATTHANKMTNAMDNIGSQTLELSSKLNQFTKGRDLAFDTGKVDVFLNRMEKLAGVNIENKTQLKSANKDFSTLEKEVNAYIKLESKYADVTDKLKILQRQGKITADDFANFSNKAKLSTTSTELNNLVKEINSFAKNTKIDTQISNAIANVGKEVDTLNSKLNRVKQTYSVKSDSPLLNSINDNMSKISNMEIKSINDVRTLESLVRETSKYISQLGGDSSSLDKFDRKVVKINDLMQKMRDSGLLTAQEMNGFSNSLSNIKSGNLAEINKLLDNMNAKFDSLKRGEKIINTEEGQMRSLTRLNSELTRTEQLYKRTFDRNVAKGLRDEITRLQSLTILDPAQLKARRKEIDDLRERVRMFQAESTQGARGSQGIIASLGTALEKFPIWLLSGTLTFMPIRGMQDMIDKTIELDSAITNLKRVMDIPSYKFDDMLQQSISSTTELSGKLGDFITLVGEFGRTGKDDIESIALAETATVLQNISELSADESVNALTAAMISFNIAASDSIQIADKLNEVNITAS